MLPNLIVIGAMKCGTTSLHHYLDAHPDVRMSRPKELDFFVAERNLRRGAEWYRSHFGGPQRIHGETSPNYAKYPMFDGVPERMHAVIPQARLIYLVRDPIERLISHYLHNRYAGREIRPIDAVVATPETSIYVQFSRYHLQVSRYLEYFPAAQLHVESAERLAEQRGETMARLFRFLDVDDTFRSPAFANVRNRTEAKARGMAGYLLYDHPLTRRLTRPFRGVAEKLGKPRRVAHIRRPVLSPATEQRLRDYLQPDQDALFGLGFGL